MSAWTKSPVESFKVAVNWSLRSEGAALVGAPVVTIGPGLSVNFVFLETSGQLSIFRLSGGVRGESGEITVVVQTAAAETIDHTVPVVIHR